MRTLRVIAATLAAAVCALGASVTAMAGSERTPRIAKSAPRGLCVLHQAR